MLPCRFLAHRVISLPRGQFGRFRTEADIGPDFMSTRPNAAYLILGENEQRRYNQELNRFLDAQMY